MSRMLRRFEVLLPLRLNDGTPVPDEAVADTIIYMIRKIEKLAGKEAKIEYLPRGRATSWQPPPT